MFLLSSTIILPICQYVFRRVLLTSAATLRLADSSKSLICVITLFVISLLILTSRLIITPCGPASAKYFCQKTTSIFVFHSRFNKFIVLSCFRIQSPDFSLINYLYYTKSLYFCQFLFSNSCKTSKPPTKTILTCSFDSTTMHSTICRTILSSYSIG